MFYSFNILNLDLVTLGIATAAIGILGFIVFFSNRKDTTHRMFLAFSLSAIIWSTFNYLSYQFAEPWITLQMIRLVIFAAIWYSFFSFQLFYVLFNKEVRYPKLYKYIFIPWVTLVSFLNLTPFTFRDIKKFGGIGHASLVYQGYGAVLFGITVVLLTIGSLYVLFYKMRRATGAEKTQLRYVFIGAVITFSSHIIFNFIFPTFFDDIRFMPWGAVFTFPLVFCTAYAIIKHHLLNIKIFAAEVLTFLIVVFSLFDVIVPRSALETVFRALTFAIVLSFSILLIRSVRGEAEQREALRKINAALDAKVTEQTREIREAYEVEKRARMELERLDETKNQFIMLTQHHLRTPLTGLRWFFHALFKEEFGPMDGEMRKIAEGASASVERLNHLIDTFLDVTQFQVGQNILSPKPTSIHNLLEEAVKELGREIERANITVQYDQAPEKWPTLFVDPAKMKEVFFAVLQNAVRYNHPGGKVIISFQHHEDMMRIIFSDTGVGVPKEEQDKVFTQLFHRGESVRRVDVLGIGIGLWVARLFIEAHKGRIWLESEGKGKGSKVYIELPFDYNVKT